MEIDNTRENEMNMKMVESRTKLKKSPTSFWGLTMNTNSKKYCDDVDE